MNLFIIIGIALGLSLDAFTVALTNSTVIKQLNFKYGLRMALFFGLFQFIMPIVGWATGVTFAKYIKTFDHWIAFFLLLFVGGKMVWSGLPFKGEKQPCSENSSKDCRNLSALFLLSIATSIDAMAIGLSFAMINIKIIFPALIIGIITFIISMFGYWIGKFIGSKIKIKLDVIGGVILIGIGLKILIEHLLGIA